MAKKSASGFIVWWKTTSGRFYVHVRHSNKNVTDSNRYPSYSGMYKKRANLFAEYPNYLIINKDKLKELLKAKKK